MRRRLWRLRVGLFLATLWPLLPCGGANAQQTAGKAHADNTFFTPRRHQWDFSLSDGWQFVDPNSIARRDNFRDKGAPPGSALRLSGDLGLSTLQLASLHTTFWFDAVNAIQFQSRYFVNYGAAGMRQTLFFNGDTIPPNQLLSMGGTRWFAFDLLYQRRLTPLYQRFNDSLPTILRGWDTRAGIGLEFVYLDFRIRDGHPRITSGRFLTRGRFHERELPLPTLTLEARHHVAGPVEFEMTAQGNWANKWDSFRSEGGTVYLSQASFETHWRFVYDNPDLLWGIRPYVGADYLYYKQVDSSGLVKDFIRAQMYGPEVGLSVSF
jgi:hypothetical protein